MKTITRDRIISTLNKIDAIKMAKIEHDLKIVMTLASYGLESIVGDNSTLTTEKMKLDANYLEAPKNKEELEALNKRLWSTVSHYCKKVEKVESIQARYDIEVSEDELDTLKIDDLDKYF